MNKLRAFALPLLVLLLAVVQTACEKPSSSTSAGHHKFGLDVNSGWEMGVVAVETGLFEWPKAAADGSAAATTAETSIGLLGPGPQAIPISSCLFHTAAALTFNASNYATLSVMKRTAGGSPVTLASLSTNVASWTAFTNVSLPVTSGSYVAPNDSVTFAITKTGTGVVVPQGELACFTSIN